MSEKKGLSRREFLKASGAAAAVAAAPKLYVPPLINRRRQNTVVMRQQPFAWDAINAVLPEFEEATGLTVLLEPGVSSGVDHLTEVTTAYAAGDSPWDVVSDSDESGPVLARAGWLMPLDDVIPQETWDDFPPIMLDALDLWHRYDGATYRIPHEFAIAYFFYRKDIFDERGLQVPTTWEEMLEVGLQLTDRDNGVYATQDSLTRNGLMFVYCAYLACQTNGQIFEFDDGTAMALHLLYNMMHTLKIFPETALNDVYDQQNENYMNDKVMFMRQWPYFQSVAEANTAWYNPDKVAIAVPPAGRPGPGSWWGGWGWTIPTFAPNPDGAKELIKFITSPEIVPRLAEGQSWFNMPRTSILNYFEGKPNPVLEAMGMYAAAGVPRPRPFHARGAEAQTVVDDIASLYLTKQETLLNALKLGKERMADLG
ncbi:MAG: extracellular solute-binding protein [Anaerolineae bacterium]|nr:extracellular solute-binding protein [Anaerolineae bacterium]